MKKFQQTANSQPTKTSFEFAFSAVIITLISQISLLYRISQTLPKPTQAGFIRFTKKTLVTYLIAFMVFSGTGLLYLFNPFGTKSAEAAWFNDEWAYRKALTIDGSKVSGSANLANFPVLVSLATDTELAANAQDDGDDIVFTSQNGERLSHEIEKFDGGTGQLIAWVKIPSLAPSVNTTIYIYYGNLTTVSQQRPTDVWDSSYNLVQHMEETSATSKTLTDSTRFANNGTKETANVPAPATGKIGGGQSKTTGGSTSDLQIANTMAYPSGTADYTMDFWLKPTVGTGSTYTFMMWGVHVASSLPTFQLSTLTTGVVRLAYDSTQIIDSAAGSITNGIYAHVVITRSGSTHTIYINGAQSGSTQSSGVILDFGTNCPLHLMAAINGTDCVNNLNQTHLSQLDEVRYSLTARSADYIATEYNNENSPSTFLSTGSEEKAPSPFVYWKFDEGRGTTANNSIPKPGTATSTPAFVQSKNTTTTIIATTAQTPVFTSTTTAGNLIIAYCTQANSGTVGTVTGVSDTAGNSYNLALTKISTARTRITMYYAYNIVAASSLRVTCTFDNGNDLKGAAALEYSGVLSSSDPLDQTSSNSGTEVGNSNVTVTSGSITTTIANELHTAGLSTDGQTFGNPQGYSTNVAATGWTDRAINQNGNCCSPFATADNLTTGTGSFQETWNWINGGEQWAAVIASFKPATSLEAIPGTLGGTTAPAWQTEDQCISAKCLWFDGSTSKVTAAVSVAGIKTVSFWVKPNTLTTTTGLIDLDGGTTKITADSSGALTATFTAPITYYINGLQTASPTLVANRWNYVVVTTGTAITASAFKVGTDNSNFTKGFFDEIKLYDSALSASQVIANYNARSNPEGVSGVLGVNTQNMPAALSNGLVGYWKTDESSGNAVDSSGNGVTLTNNNTTAYAAGMFGNAASFTAASSRYLSTATTISGVKTVSFWTNNASTTDEYINLTSGAYITSSSGTVSANGFTSPKIYVNGVLNGTLTASVWNHVVITSDTATNANAFEVGRGNSAYNNGKIDETRVYNRALSPAEVSQLYNWGPGPVGYWKLDEGSGTNAYDSSGSGNNGTWNGTTTSIWTPGKYGSAGNFNGTNNSITVATNTNFPTKDATYELWVNLNSLSTGHSLMASADGVNDQFNLEVNTSGNIIYAPTGNNGGGTLTTNGSITAGTWYHIAAIRSNNNVNVYINGIKDSATTTNSQTISYASVCATYIGADYNTGCSDPTWQPTNAKLDDIKIYNYGRTQSQVVEDLNAGHPAPGSPVGTPVAYWKLDEGISTTAHDSNSSTGGAEDLTLSHTAAWTNSGKFAKAWNGDGSRWLSRADDDDLDFAAADNFTISLWFKSNSTTNPGSGTAEYLVSKLRSSATPKPGYAIVTDSLALGLICLGIDDDSTLNFEDVACSTTDLYDANWHYLTATKTGTSRIDFYVDGVLNSSKTSLIETGSLANDRTFYLGDFDGVDNGSELNGTLDEVKIFRSALTADQVKLDYNRGTSQQLGSLTSGTSNTDSNNASTQEYCIPGDSTTCTAPFGRWDFEQKTGTTANDTSTNAYDATFAGSTIPTWTTGKIGSGVDFSGTGSSGTASRLTVNSSASVRNLTSYTVEAWVKLAALSGTETIYAESTNSPGTARLQLFADPAAAKCAGGKFGVSFRSLDANSIQNLCATTAPVANTWYHMTFVFNSTTDIHRVYINGVQENTSTFAASTVSDTPPSDGIAMGAFPSGTSLLTGTIDNVKLFNYERTPAQIAWDMNRGAPVAHWKMDECQGTSLNDSSGNGNTGTLTLGASGQTSVGTCTGTAGTSWKDGATGKRNASVEFDGVDDYATVAGSTSLNTASPITIAAWVKTTDTNFGAIYYAVGGSFEGLAFAVNPDADSVGDIGYYNGTTFAWTQSNRTGLNDGNWHHVVVTVNGTTATFYIDGVLESVHTGSGQPSANTGTKTIGGLSGSSLDGQLDDLRIYNYSLTATQVKTLFNGGVTRYGPATGAP